MALSNTSKKDKYNLSTRFTIPDVFRSEDKKISVKLKSKIHGYIDLKSNVFHSTYPVFQAPVVSTTPAKAIKEIKALIIDIYFKGVKNRMTLTGYEASIFYHIHDLVDRRKYSNKTLVIGCDSADIFSIKTIAAKFDTSCSSFELVKNIELYNNADYEATFASLENKINKNKYNKFIFDITTVYLPTDYEFTKRIIKLLEEHGDVLILIDRFDSARIRFNNIFGKEYDDRVLDKERFINADLNLSLYRIQKILYGTMV